MPWSIKNLMFHDKLVPLSCGISSKGMIIFAVVASNIHWHWNPNPCIPAGAGLADRYMTASNSFSSS
jgi:hypothetical protein